MTNTPAITFHDTEEITFEEYVDFLKRCDLGSQYPKQNFENRIKTLLKNANIRITARNQTGVLIGICFGITDFAYFLFLTDLGVDRAYVRHGIGKKLLFLAHQQAGGENDITMVTIAHENALGFYDACGLKPHQQLVVKFCKEWEDFVVGQE